MKRMCSETGDLMSQWSGGSKVSVNGGTTQMANWKQFQCKGTGNREQVNSPGVEASAV